MINMDKSQQLSIEDKALSLAKEQITKWTNRLENIGIEIGELFVSRSGNDASYYSEIEFNLWKENNLETAFSLIIFMKGKQSIGLEEIPIFIDTELDDSLENI
jgi:hypothetical protein